MELDAYWNYISFKLGNGERIELWKDVQIGLLFFSFQFYYLYLKVVNKNSFVASYWNQRYQECKIWPVEPISPTKFGQLDQLMDLFFVVWPSISIDMLVYKHCKDDIFSIDS